MKKINHIMNKPFAIYANKNLVIIIENTLKSEIIVIALENIEALLIMLVI